MLTLLPNLAPSPLSIPPLPLPRWQSRGKEERNKEWSDLGCKLFRQRARGRARGGKNEGGRKEGRRIEVGMGEGGNEVGNERWNEGGKEGGKE